MSGQLALGIDLGGTKLLVALVAEDGEVVASAQHATPERDRPVEDLMTAVVGAVQDLAQGREVAMVGLAAAGFVDPTRSRVVFAPHLAWRGDDVRADLADRLGLPVALDNDANCAALAEATYGAARGASSALMVTLGTGIGGALLLGGRLWRGANGMAGEFGHMEVERGGRECQCGRTGCWEQYCSGHEIARLAGQVPSVESGEGLARARREGDEAALRAHEVVGEWLGRGVANLVAAFDPAVVVVGGGAAAAGDMLLEPARRALADSLVAAEHRSLPVLVPAALGSLAGAVGATVLARREQA